MFTYCFSLMPCYEYALVLYISVIVCMSSQDMIVELDVEMMLSRVSATGGVGLRSRTIVVMDLDI
jgi:hypothetical protein